APRHPGPEEGAYGILHEAIHTQPEAMVQETEWVASPIGLEISLELTRGPRPAVVRVLSHIRGEIGIKGPVDPVPADAVHSRLHQLANKQIIENLPLNGTDQGMARHLECDTLLFLPSTEADGVVTPAHTKGDVTENLRQVTDRLEILADFYHVITSERVSPVVTKLLGLYHSGRHLSRI